MSANNSLNRKIKKIRLQNFQSHADSTIEFEDGLNLIVGSNEQGKTASARALAAVLYNKTGNHHVRWHQPYCMAEITFMDGAIIRRYKGKDINKVEFKYAGDEDFKTYKSFGVNYPDEVNAFLGFPPVSSKLGPIAYSDQTEKNFLINIPSSQLAGVISSLIGVDDLDDAAVIRNSQVKILEKSNKALENEIKFLNNELEVKYADLDSEISKLEQFEKDILECKELQKNVNDLTNFKNLNISVSTRGKKAKKEVRKAKEIIDNLKDIENLESYFNSLKSMHEYYTKSETYNKKINKVKKEIDQYKDLIDSEIKQTTDSAKTDIDIIKDYANAYNEAFSLSNNIKDLKNDIKECETNISNLTTEYKDLIKEATDNGAICSACNKIGGDYVEQ